MVQAEIEPDAFRKVSCSSLTIGIEAYDENALCSGFINVHETRTDSEDPGLRTV
jgi:hypothetical protein